MMFTLLTVLVCAVSACAQQLAGGYGTPLGYGSSLPPTQLPVYGSVLSPQPSVSPMVRTIPLPLAVAPVAGQQSAVLPEPSMLTENCTADVMMGDIWLRESIAYRSIYIRLENLKGTDEPIPWTFVVEGPAFVNVTDYWNFELEEFQPGYFSGVVDEGYQNLLANTKNVVELGFIAELASVGDDAAPLFVSVAGSECYIVVVRVGSTPP